MQRNHHHLRIVAASTGLALAVTAVATTAVSASPAARGPATLRLDFTTSWTEGVYSNVDVGEEGPGPGDLVLFTEVPMGSDRGDIGTIEGVETLMSPAFDGTVSQEMTLRLDGGLVMVAGVVRHDTVPYDLAVIGGTGRYLKARGNLTVLGDDEQRQVSLWRLTVTR